MDVDLALRAGHRLGEFEVIRSIGQGGFGIVYLAQADFPAGAVAVKEYLPGSIALRTASGAVQVRRSYSAERFQAGLNDFVHEARLLARLRHPGLPHAGHCWRENGTAYYSMPWYPGPTLQRLVTTPSPALSPDWLENLLGCLLGALERLHESGHLHGDIAPDNIILDAQDQPVLLDPNACIMAGSGLSNGFRPLKPGYSPLELHLAQQQSRGCWSDLYSLAAVLHLLLIGHAPPSALARTVVDTCRPLGSLGLGDYPQPMLAAIDRALSLHAADRPQNVAEFADALGLRRQGWRYWNPASIERRRAAGGETTRTAAVRR
jgi:non-specific serine/threonine protein kinase